MPYAERKATMMMNKGDFGRFTKELERWGFRDVLARHPPPASGKADGTDDCRMSAVRMRKRDGYDLFVMASARGEANRRLDELPEERELELRVVYSTPEISGHHMLLTAYENKLHYICNQAYAASLVPNAHVERVLNSAAAFNQAIEFLRYDPGVIDALDARELYETLSSALGKLPEVNQHRADAEAHLESFLALYRTKYEAELIILRTTAAISSAMDLVADRESE